MEVKWVDNVTEILQHYAILPQGMTKVTNRLTQVKANGRKYALKRSKLNQETIKQWVSVYHTASRQNLHEIVPIYLTKDKQLFVKKGKEYYYLMPWIEKNRTNPDENRVHSIYQQIGRIHVQTKSLYALNKNKLSDNFNSYKDNCKRDETRLLAWIERIEQTHYPSPFELQVLTYYRDLRLSLHRSQALVDRIISLSEEEDSWGVSLNHGNLEVGHLFEHYIINWERASYKHAVYDLTDLLHQETVKEPHLQKEFIQSFPVYMEENPLNNLEQSLLCLYLLNTDSYLRLIESYSQSPQKIDSDLKVSMKLERYHRQLVFGLRFDAQIDDLVTRIKED